ncbi:alanine/arginine aminopeptidase/aminopeptidase [Blumeria hordei DH14]|uniref:Aminopeptidase n=1 Tax=Blumeria graminis f. sp. hordei (strain DH14) TaxID=546991 RepID=N1JHT7_BLUG1|nr:alanine/arginine aminopeptidase/aminopeptidase [Blumeria hordei DH14]
MESSENLDRDILPGFFKPLQYDISLFNLEFGGDFNYEGTVRIVCRVEKKTRELTLNAYQLTLYSAEIFPDPASSSKFLVPHKISYDEPTQRVKIIYEEEIPVSAEAVIIIKFQGTINYCMSGFYRSKYKPVTIPAASLPQEGDYTFMFSTQFESCDARRAFPCFDEPNLKATFDLQLEIPEDLVALSNMPIKYVCKAKQGLQAVSFETTPIMSTYLLAWAIGDFEYIEAFTKRKYENKLLPVRIYTTRGIKYQGQFALEHAPQIVDYFSEIFGIDYPLPKCDLLAVHEFVRISPLLLYQNLPRNLAQIANRNCFRLGRKYIIDFDNRSADYALIYMENWGLITYRTTALLFDDQVSDVRYKKRIAYVVAHELAHHWFGNLVTMDWWNELWLNEGFATWVGWLATDYLHPEWDVWPQFVAEGMQTAFTLDSLRSSHPIEVPVKDALDVDQIFDSISYLKGSSVIRMLATYLGQDIFLEGISIYLKAHAYGNAKTADLWRSLSQISGKQISRMMDFWIKRIGFPILSIVEKPGQIIVRQDRYLSIGNLLPEENNTIWWVPLGLESKDCTTVILTTKEATFDGIDNTFYHINQNTSGFFRTIYPPSRLIKLISILLTTRIFLIVILGMVGDAGALAFSGEASTSGLLTFIEGFQSESSFFLWSQILDSLSIVKLAFHVNKSISKGLKLFILKLISPALEKVGWEPLPDEDISTTQLRSLLILNAGLNGFYPIILEAKRRFELYITGKDRKAIHQNLRSAIFGLAIRKGGVAEYRALKSEWRSSSSIDGREIILCALGQARYPELHQDYLHFLSTEVATQDVHTGAKAMAINPTSRMALWEYIKDHFDEIRDTFGHNSTVLSRYLRLSLDKFNDRNTEKDIRAFFSNKDNRGYDRTLAIISDTILGRVAYQERDMRRLKEWLKLHGHILD